MEWFKSISELTPDQLALMVPIVGIVCLFFVGGLLSLTKLVFRHRERMAMIEQGIHPDSLAAEEESKTPAPH